MVDRTSVAMSAMALTVSRTPRRKLRCGSARARLSNTSRASSIGSMRSHRRLRHIRNEYWHPLGHGKPTDYEQ